MHIREVIQVEKEESIKTNYQTKLRILADRKKAQVKKQAEEDKFLALRQQKDAERVFEIGKIMNENQLLANIELSYLESLKNTQQKLNDTQAMTMIQSGIFDRMSNNMSATTRNGKLKGLLMRSDYAQTPERSKRIKFYTQKGSIDNTPNSYRLTTPAVGARFRNIIEDRTPKTTERNNININLKMWIIIYNIK